MIFSELLSCRFFVRVSEGMGVEIKGREHGGDFGLSTSSMVHSRYLLPSFKKYKVDIG